MKKGRVFIYLALIFFNFSVIGCTNDDNRQDLEIDLTPPQEYDGLSISFQLLNKDGKPVTTFYQGDSISFKLSIRNTTDQAIKVYGENELFGDDLFSVYSADGKNMGKPWDDYIKHYYLFDDLIQPSASDTYQCSWFSYFDGLDDPDNAILRWKDVSNKVVFLKAENRLPLPRGNYYSVFQLKLNNNKIVTCRKEFKVI